MKKTATLINMNWMGLLCRLLLPLMVMTVILRGSEGQASPLHEIRVGILYHDLGLWGGSSLEEGIDFNGELIFSPSAPILGGLLRPNLGLSLNDRGDTSKIYGGGVWEYFWNSGWFIDLGLGLCVHNGETDDADIENSNQLGSPVLFRLSIEAGFTLTSHQRLSLMFDHISNAYLADPNEGLDTLGIRYGYRF